MSVEIEFDAEKDRANQAKHGLSLTLAKLLFKGIHVEKQDDRGNYGEVRMIAKGFVQGRLCVCVYTWRGEYRRIISLRRANRRECDAYHKTDS